VLLVNTTILLRDLLVPLNVDSRIFDFILLVWARVLVRTYWLESVDGAHADQTGPLSQQFRETLAELVWSAQHKVGAEERNQLLQILPTLVLRVKTGLHMIQLPELERSYALDQLVAVHTQVLRSMGHGIGSPVMQQSLEQLRQHFSRLVLTRDQAKILPEQEWDVPCSVVEEVLAGQGITASLHVANNASMFENDREILEQLHLGVWVECWSSEAYHRAQLTWVSLHKSLYLFSGEHNNVPLVYSPGSFVAALRDGVVRFVEYAPVFDRAVESLMSSAEALEADSHAV
jgi:predicted GNAT family acetyltransferase